MLLPGDARVPELRTSVPAKARPLQPITRITPPLLPVPPRPLPTRPAPDGSVATATETSDTMTTEPQDATTTNELIP